MTLPRRAEADPRALLTRLSSRLAREPLRELGEGWDNVAYAVGSAHVLRVAKHASAPERRRNAERDVRLLEFVERHSSLPTSRVLAADLDEGALLCTLVPGRPADVLAPGDLDEAADTIAAFVSRLHCVPADEASGVVTVDSPLQDWFDETVRDYEAAAHLFEPSDRAPIEAFLREPLPSAPARLTFCHNDLRDQHVIVDEGTRQISGVIDWSDAVLGDPARDLALLVLDLGPRFARRLLTGYDGSRDTGLPDRVQWFARHAGVEGVAYRATHRRPSLDVAMAALRAALRDDG
jgi:aminoglycoside phosphotransferase (APT) family kinase protein